jgi:hypothetical protein
MMMGGILITVLGLSGYILPATSLIWAWAAWLKSRSNPDSPTWRTVSVFVGLILASVTGLVVVLMVAVVGGMPESGTKYSLAMKGSGLGFLASILALVLSLIGKGPARLPASLASFGLAALWLVAALTY